MADAASQSPFARLDTDLMRSTKPPADSPLVIVPKPQQQPAQSQKIQPERANPRTMERSNGRRIITRNSFEIYEDQMDSLRKLAARELETKGKLGSMSAMVRVALDTYIQKQSSEK
jgi:hypothetical protein